MGAGERRSQLLYCTPKGINNRSYAVRVQTDRLFSITAYFACGSMVRFCLFPEHLALRAKCSGKECSIPPCRRRIGPFVQADAWFGTDCVTPVNKILTIAPHPLDNRNTPPTSSRAPDGRPVQDTRFRCCAGPRVRVRRTIGKQSLPDIARLRAPVSVAQAQVLRLCVYGTCRE